MIRSLAQARAISDAVADAAIQTLPVGDAHEMPFDSAWLQLRLAANLQGVAHPVSQSCANPVTPTN